MTFEVVWSARARRSLNRLDIGVAHAVVEHVVGPIADAPERLGKELRLPPLVGLRAARRGEYRILYEVDGDRQRVVVVDVQHRRDAYRRR